ncbi:MAG TPA: hypothetical protein G4O10_00080 [Dehalococcoidia bacterium]|nr:hypothetical protein [Dehalococcoidia bacterium]
MLGLYLFIPTLLTIFLSYLVVRAGAIALMMTGMDQQKARFQALSAFSRAGFTTREAEAVVNDPKRRRIVTLLIILGNAGLVAVIVTATSSITTSEGYNLPITVAVIIEGALVLYLLASRSRFAGWRDSFIEKRLVKSQVLEEGATEDLLHCMEGYGIVKVIVASESPFIGSSFSDIRRLEENLQVLGIERGKDWIPFPKANDTIQDDDKLVVYGHINVLKSLFGQN